jgi:hypothetical protein
MRKWGRETGKETDLHFESHGLGALNAGAASFMRQAKVAIDINI